MSTSVPEKHRERLPSRTRAEEGVARGCGGWPAAVRRVFVRAASPRATAAFEKLQQETIGATKERMLREMGDALGALAAQAPVVLLLEDLHWADPSSVDLLRHLSQRIPSQRVLIVGTFRPEDLERSSHPLKNYKAEMKAHKFCEEIELGSLGQQHIPS